MITPDPRYLSQDIPVALPDEPVRFAVEETAPKLKPVLRPAPPRPTPPKPGIIELTEDDIIEE